MSTSATQKRYFVGHVVEKNGHLMPCIVDFVENKLTRCETYEELVKNVLREIGDNYRKIREFSCNSPIDRLDLKRFPRERSKMFKFYMKDIFRENRRIWRFANAS